MTESEIIDAGRRVAQFLDDPAVQQVFAKLEQQYFVDFKTSTTADERTVAHAKANVLDDVRQGLRAVKDAGTRTRVEAERRAPRTPPKPRGRRS